MANKIKHITLAFALSTLSAIALAQPMAVPAPAPVDQSAVTQQAPAAKPHHAKAKHKKAHHAKKKGAHHHKAKKKHAHATHHAASGAMQ